MTPSIEVFPQTCLLDEVWNLRLFGLNPGQAVTLLCRVNEDNIRYFAYAYYTSDVHGCIDAAKSPAQKGGSYEGVEPMGLIWAQGQEPGQKPGRRLVKSDITKPIATHIYALDGHQDSTRCLQLVADGAWITMATCQRIHMAPGVTRKEVREGRLVGTLFLPPGKGPFPTIVDMFGATVGVMEHRPALFASRGVAALGLCYSSPKVHHGIIEDIEYFEEAVDYLLRQEEVQKPYVGIVGLSKGAEFAMLTAAMCPDKIRVCVEVNGPDMCTLQTHTYKGEKFGYDQIQQVKSAMAESGVIRFSTLFGLHDPEQRASAGIPVERANKCHFLLIHGEDDHCVPLTSSINIASRLSSHGNHNYRCLHYGGAGHLIDPPYSPHFCKTYHALFSNLMDWGGQTHGHAKAQEHSWTEILSFIKKYLGEANHQPPSTVPKSVL